MKVVSLSVIDVVEIRRQGDDYKMAVANQAINVQLQGRRNLKTKCVEKKHSTLCWFLGRRGSATTHYPNSGSQLTVSR